MNKQILACDLSDMMLQEAIQYQSNKLYINRTSVTIGKKLGAGLSFIEKCVRMFKRATCLSFSAGHSLRKLQFITELSLLYILCFASVPLVLLWFNLLVN